VSGDPLLLLLLTPLRQALERIERKARPLLTTSFPDIDWKGAMGFRDVIAHQYFDLDAERVLLICQEALPGLLEASALRRDQIGPGWDDGARRRSRVGSRASLHRSAVSLPPDLLHKRIGDVIEAVAHPHQQIVGEQLIHHRLNLFNPHRPPDHFAIGRRSLY
jgi:hypothetical protein